MKRKRRSLLYIISILGVFLVGIFAQNTYETGTTNKKNIFFNKINHLASLNNIQENMPEKVLESGILPNEIRENTILKKGNYSVDADLTILENITLKVEAGVTITFSKGKKITVLGTLSLMGMEEEKVTINYSSNKGENFLLIETTGKVKSTYTNIKNTYWEYSQAVINTIYNKGILNMDKCTLQDDTVDTNITSSGSIHLTNSTLPNDVIIMDGNSDIIIKNNKIEHQLIVSLAACDQLTFQNIQDNLTIKQIHLIDQPKKDVKLYKQLNQEYVRKQDLIIPENTTFEVEKGTHILFDTENTKVNIFGTFRLLGTEEEKISINYSVNKGSADFLVIEKTGTLETNYIDITNRYASVGYGNQSNAIYNQGTLIMNHATLVDNTISIDITSSGRIHLTNSTLPNDVIIMDGNSDIVIKNNKIERQLVVSLAACDQLTFQNIQDNLTIKQIHLIDQPKKDVKLYKQLNQKYVRKQDLIIPENTTFEVEKGTHILFDTENIKVDILGNLRFLGTKEETININYSLYKETFLSIKETGTIEANYTNIENRYASYLYLPNDYVITNKGNLIMDHTIISTKSAHPHIENNGNISLTNSKIPYYLYLNEGSNHVVVENNQIGYNIEINSKVKGILKISNNETQRSELCSLTISFHNVEENTFANIKGNYNSIRQSNSAIELKDNPIGNVKLTGQKYILKNEITIPEHTVFEVEAGSTLQIPSKKGIYVNGTFHLAGDSSNPILLTNGLKDSEGSNYYWLGLVINKTGVAIINNAEIKNGGYSGNYYVSGYNIENQGQLIMWNSKVATSSFSANAIRYNTKNPNQILVNNALLQEVTSNIPLQASYNYWGKEDGPTRKDPSTSKIVGSGARVSDNIFVYPYNTTFVKNDIESFEFIDISVYEQLHFGKQGVHSLTGNYSTQYTDFEPLSTIGIPIQRIYNSKNKKEGILGKGWTFSFSSKVEKHPLDEKSYIVYLPDSSINIFIEEENTFTSLNSRNILSKEENKYTLTLPTQTIYTYDISGKLESITDPYGNKTLFTYNEIEQLIKITDPVGRTYLLSYNTNHLLSKIIDPLKREVTFYYNEQHLLEKVVDISGVETKYLYKEDKKLTKEFKNNVLMTQIEYGEDERVYQKIDKTGNQITYTYDNTSNLTTETDSNGRVTQKYFDREGYIYKLVDPNKTTTLTTYLLEGGQNKYGEVLSVTKQNTAKTTYTRDSLGRITKITYPDSSIKQYFYNTKNKVIKEVDELGNVIEYIYDTDEVTLLKEIKLLDKTKPYEEDLDPSLYEATTYSYDNENVLKGLIKTKTDQKGTTLYTYNLYGDINTITDGNGNVTSYLKNILGWVLKEQVNDGYITEYEYDEKGNQVKVLKNSKIYAKTEYDYQDNPIKKMDGNCTSTDCPYESYVYDKASNMLEKIDREGNRTQFEYDVYGNRIKKIDPNGSIHLYEYDSLNRLKKTYFKETEQSEPLLEEENLYALSLTSTITTKTYISPTVFKTTVKSYNSRQWLISEKKEANTSTIAYYKNGKISYEIDANGGYTYYYYNQIGHLIKKYEQVSGSNYICTIYTYDSLGRVVEEKVGKNFVSNNGTPTNYYITTYEYDNIGQVIQKTTSGLEEILYTYDAYGNLLQEKTKIADEKYQVKEYKYNVEGKVIEEKREDEVITYEYDPSFHLIKKTTAENRVTTYEYNKNYDLVKTILAGNVIEQLTYDSMGNLIKKIDGNGFITSYVYDKRNNLIKETNPNGFIKNYTYDRSNRLIEVQEGNKTILYIYDLYDNVIEKKINNEIIYKYTYDKNHNLTRETDPLLYTTYFFYNNKNLLTQKTNKLGNTITYQYDTRLKKTAEKNEKDIYTYYSYDERGNVTTKKIGTTIIEQKEYDLLNHLIKKIDGNGSITKYTYNTKGQVIKEENALGYIIEYQYNKDGNKIKETDSLGKQTLYFYDERENIIKKVEQKEDGTEKIEIIKEYDLNNNLIKEMDGNKNITTYEYDGMKNMTKKTNPLQEETTYQYDAFNHLIKETNHQGDAKTYQYDAFGRLIEKKNELNETIEKLEYDLNGRQVKSINALSNETIYVYDKMDHVIEVIDPLGFVEKKTYDALGNVLTKIDKNGFKTTYTYDSFNNLTKVTNALGEITSYTYDKMGNILKVTDANNKTITYTYDALNNELTETDALGNKEIKEYSSNGLLKKKTTRNNQDIVYTYDIHGRVIQEQDIFYQYDNNDNLLEIKENNKKIVREYDSLNRVIKKTEDGFISSYLYDKENYLEKTIDPKGNEITKKYDQAGRLIEVLKEATYLYNLDGSLKQITYANGAKEEYFYNKDGTLKKVINTYKEEKQEFLYTYDANKNIIRKIENGKEYSYTYDALNRLKTISEVSTVIKEDIEEEVFTLLTSYTYDKVGNRIKEEVSDTIKEYTYNSKNQVTKIIEKKNNEIVKTTLYTYDNNGNQLEEKVNEEIKQINTYNERNELIKTIVDGKEIRYTYNAEGKRITKESDNQKRKYIYEDLHIILELDENKEILAKNVYGLSLLSRITNQKGYYLYNGHGDTVGIVNENNEILNTYTYDEWGNIKEETGSFENPYLYAGYYYDEETGNYYLISRYYNPILARFISEDSYRGEYTDPLSLNRYVYVSNNPLIYIDPEGYFLKESLEWIGKRTLGLVQGTGEFAFDAIIGIGKLAYNTGEFIGSGVGLAINYGIHELGFTDENTYHYLSSEYSKTFERSGNTFLNLPENMLNGIKSNFETTFNVGNFVNYLTTDNYNEIKEYSKSVVQTGVTLYGSYNVGKGISNFASSIEITSKTIPVGNVLNSNGTLSTIGINVPVLSGVNTTILNQSLINGVTGTIAISTNGNNGGNFEEPAPKNPKLVDDKYLKKHGIDPHDFKKDQIPGNNVNRSNYNIYIDHNGSIWLLKNGTKKFIPTYENIDWYNK